LQIYLLSQLLILLIIKLMKQEIIETTQLFRLIKSLFFTILNRLTRAKQFKEC